jgi:acetylglutamate kinase
MTDSHTVSSDARLTDPANLQHLRGQTILIKYGGNAMVDDSVKQSVIEDITILKKAGAQPVVVHGGGPFIKQLLEQVGIDSEFIDGHRKTDREAMEYVEMALSGNVNGELIKHLNANGVKAVGLSGKDAGLVSANKRQHTVTLDGETTSIDLGHVGDVASVDTTLITQMLELGYVPVIAPIGVGDDLKDYNINADMFAGHVAGALQADHFMALTDVDGLLMNLDDPDSIVHEATIEDIQTMMGNSIQGGMIPKTEACLIALKEGVSQAHILNGTTPHSLLKSLSEEQSGTIITNQ